MQIAVHHAQKHARTPAQTTAFQKKLNRIMDKVIYVIGTFGLLIFIPQLIKVWSAGSISGVSLLSWSGMAIASIFWLCYGLVHKARPIIFINIMASIIQILVVVGILLHQ